MIGALRWTSLVGTSNFYRNKILILKNINCLRVNAVNIVRPCTSMRKISERLHNQLKIKDKVEDDYVLIYRSTLHNYIMSFQFGLFFVIPVGIYTILFTIYKYQDFEFPMEIVPDLYVEDMFQFVLFLSVTSWSIYLLSSMCNQFPLRIYHNKKTKLYKAIFASRIPLQTWTFEFSEGTAVKKQQLSQYFVPWMSFKYVINNRSLFLIDSNFRTQAHFLQMLKEKPV